MASERLRSNCARDFTSILEEDMYNLLSESVSGLQLEALQVPSSEFRGFSLQNGLL